MIRGTQNRAVWLFAGCFCLTGSAWAQLPPVPGRPPVAEVAAAPMSELFEPAETAARVGDQVIFVGELMGDANVMLAPMLEEMDAAALEQSRLQIEQQRKQFMKQLLPSVIDRKLMYIAFLRSIPADKLTEARQKIDEQVAEMFEENLYKMLTKVQTQPQEDYPSLSRQENQLFRLAYLMKQNNLTSLRQLETVLRRHGSSLEKQRQSYGERMLGQEGMKQSIELKPEITPEEMQKYYEEHLADYQVPARARWQQLTIRFNRTASKQEAGAKIAELGNQLVLGAPFTQLAERESHGPQANEGGYHDWTEWGSLEISREINQRVFQLPLNELSEIISDSEGYHIVRVLEREDARVIPFSEAQVEIKSTLRNNKINQSIEKYVTDLREQIPVWKADL